MSSTVNKKKALASRMQRQEDSVKSAADELQNLTANMNPPPPLKKRKVTAAGAAKSRAAPTVASRKSLNVSNLKQAPSVGAASSIVETPDLIRKAEQELEEAIEEIDENEAAAYMEALQVAPELISRESNPVRFLRCERFDATAAARRLCAYWTCRKQILGEDRAYLPVLDLSGKGALTASDVELLSSGMTAKLPDDEAGKTVLCQDRSLLDVPDKVVNERFLRVNFYWFHVAAENPASQTSGFHLLKVLKKPAFDRAQFQAMIHVIQTAMPVRLASFHLCCIPPPGGKKAFTETIIPITLQMLGNAIDGKKAVAHLAPNEEKMATKLATVGFDTVSLPITLGGTWTYDKFAVWLKQRIRVAEEESVKLAALKTKSPQESMDTLLEAADIALVNERKARKRKMDAIYARKRRERERVEEENLQDQCFQLSKKNMLLEEENKKLDQLLAEAKSKVMQHERSLTKPASAAPPTPRVAPPTVVAPRNGPPTATLAPQVTAPLQVQAQAPQLSLSEQGPSSLHALESLLTQHGLEGEVQKALERERALRDQLLNTSASGAGFTSAQTLVNLLSGRQLQPPQPMLGMANVISQPHLQQHQIRQAQDPSQNLMALLGMLNQGTNGNLAQDSMQQLPSVTMSNSTMDPSLFQALLAGNVQSMPAAQAQLNERALMQSCLGAAPSAAALPPQQQLDVLPSASQAPQQQQQHQSVFQTFTDHMSWLKQLTKRA